MPSSKPYGDRSPLGRCRADRAVPARRLQREGRIEQVAEDPFTQSRGVLAVGVGVLGVRGPVPAAADRPQRAVQRVPVPPRQVLKDGAVTVVGRGGGARSVHRRSPQCSVRDVRGLREGVGEPAAYGGGRRPGRGNGGAPRGRSRILKRCRIRGCGERSGRAPTAVSVSDVRWVGGDSGARPDGGSPGRAPGAVRAESSGAPPHTPRRSADRPSAARASAGRRRLRPAPAAVRGRSCTGGRTP